MDEDKKVWWKKPVVVASGLVLTHVAALWIGFFIAKAVGGSDKSTLDSLESEQ